jgi:hypothetical protein
LKEGWIEKGAEGIIWGKRKRKLKEARKNVLSQIKMVNTKYLLVNLPNMFHSQ